MTTQNIQRLLKHATVGTIIIDEQGVHHFVTGITDTYLECNYVKGQSLWLRSGNRNVATNSYAVEVILPKRQHPSHDPTHQYLTELLSNATPQWTYSTYVGVKTNEVPDAYCPESYIRGPAVAVELAVACVNAVPGLLSRITQLEGDVKELRDGPIEQCPHCHSTKEAWFSRDMEDPGWFCSDCGMSVHLQPTAGGKD